MKKVLSIFIFVFIVLFTIGCKEEINLSVPSNLKFDDKTGVLTWDDVEAATSYVVKINEQEYQTESPFYLVTDLKYDFVCVVKAINGEIETEYSEQIVYNAPKIILPERPKLNITIGINGSSDIKSGKQITLKANVTGGETNEVTWSVTKGDDYVSIDQNGVLTANDKALNEKDVIVEVTATSKEDPKVKASKLITVLSKPQLTQEMLDAIGNEDYLQFDGYINISVYPIGSKQVHQTYSTVIKTALDGDYWYAEYENNQALIKQNIFYKNHQGLACQVGINFMNQEEYHPSLDENGNGYTWEEYGLYNNFKGLKISDFSFNEEQWRWEYSGSDEKLDERMIASMNPYDFKANGFSLIIEDDEILGVYAKSSDDYTIVQQYVSIQELFVVINKGEENVEVKKVPTYVYDEEVHGPLKEALEKLQNANNLTLKFLNTQASVMTSTPTESYYIEYITDTDCYFEPYDISYNGSLQPVYTPSKSGTYGFHKFDDNMYNSYYEVFDTLGNHKEYQAARAFEADFKNAKPSFGFVPEIFTQYFIDEEDKTTTYYVDDIMSGVASTFYYGVGNDINLYGIYATRGYISTTESFTPYIVVNNETNEIKSACFYYYLGYIYGVIEVSYENVNQTVLPENVNIDFERREVPTSWDQLTIIVTTDKDVDEKEENAAEYLLRFFEVADNEEAKEQFFKDMPFFGKAIGDTYGFAMTQYHIDAATNTNHPSILFYYDVPLDINYSIESSIKKVEDYLISIGFVRNKHGEFNKGNIWVHPVDNNLDFQIHVWKQK